MGRWMHAFALCALVAGGCDDSTSPGAEGGQDAAVQSADAGPDAGLDEGLDAPADAAPPDRGWVDAAPLDAVPPDAARLDVVQPDAAPEPDAEPPAPPRRAPLITEFVARNDSGLLDDRGRTSDWIELYNPHRAPIDLAGFGLSDGDADDAWILPPRTLQPGEYLIVFASGDDVAGRAGPLHADFRLDADGEPLSLLGPDGALIQRFASAPRAADVAVGLPATALLAPGAEVAYRVEVPARGWVEPAFDDSDWRTGPTGLGRDPGGPPSALDPWAEALASHWTFDRIAEDADGAILALDDRGGSPRHLRLEGAARLVDGRDGQGMTGGFARGLAAEGFDFSADFTWSLWMNGRDDSGALIARNAPGIAWSRGAKALFVRRGIARFDAGWVGAPRTMTWVDEGVWHHIAVSYRADDDRMVITIDGVPRFDQVFDANAFPEDLDDPPVRSGFFVGGTDFTGGLPDLGPYDGLIDDVSVWSAALPAEALGLLAAGEPMPNRGPFADLIATPLEADGVYLRAGFDAPDGLAAAALRVRYDDRFAAWLDGAPVAAGLESPRDDGRARNPVDAPLPPLAGPHLLAVEAAADAADAADPARWVVLPEVWSLEAEPAALLRPTPGALNAAGRSPAVVIDPPEGVVREPLAVQLRLAGPAGRPTAIHCTTDGRAPTADDPVCDGGLVLDGPAVVRAVAIAEGRAPGPVASAVFTALEPALAGFESTLPVVVIDRGGQGMPVRETYGDGLLVAWMPGADGLTRLTDAPTLVSRTAIRVRGQSSSGAPKAPYRIELRDEAGRDRAEPLLGLPPDADWVLHGPYWDKSLVRNALVYGLGRDLGLTAPRAALFELYLRGADGAIGPEDARGVYLLVERIELGPDRLDLPEIEPEDAAEPAISGGWVLKFEAGVAEAPLVPGWQSLEIVSPADPTPPQRDWIAVAVAAFDQALDAPDFASPDAAWRGQVDVQSAIDQLIVNELFRDQDAYVRSAYLHRDRGGPWVMGPLWDYNLVAGVGGFFENTRIAGWQFRQGYNAGEHGWYVRMMDDPAFAAAVAARWRALRGELLADAAIAERVDGLIAALAGPAARNFAIWPNLGNGRINPFVTPASATWEDQIELLLDWLAQRSAWIDGQWAQ